MLKRMEQIVRISATSLLLAGLLTSLSSARNNENVSAEGKICQLTWKVVPTPTVGTSGSGLSGIGVVSASDIWVVGSYDDDGIPQMLIEHWDGSSWSIFPSPGLGRLFDIAIVSANDIWAVGDRFVHWDGSTWSVASESPGANAVTALDPNNAWAAGYGTETRFWNGNSWQSIPTPPLDTSANELKSIIAVSSSDIWAVGWESPGSIGFYSLAYHWDGKNWTSTSLPNRWNTRLEDVDAIASNDVWTVGYKFWGKHSTLVEHWDGSQWSIVTSPNPKTISYTDEVRLTGIDSIGSNDIWAVGTFGDFPSGYLRPFLEHWNGTDWSLVAIPNLDRVDSTLEDIATVSEKNIWAVGSSSNEHKYQALILHGSLPRPRPPHLLTPTENAVLSKRRVLLDWNARPCATSYNLVLRRGSTSGRIVEQVTGLTETQYKTKALKRGAIYFWSMQACNVEGCGRWSEWQSFTVSVE